jgi:hypothetical protein
VTRLWSELGIVARRRGRIRRLAYIVELSVAKGRGLCVVTVSPAGLPA